MIFQVEELDVKLQQKFITKVYICLVKRITIKLIMITVYQNVLTTMVTLSITLHLDKPTLIFTQKR